MESGDTAKLTLPSGEVLSLPMLLDAAGGRFLDVRRLYGESGLCCFDPGFSSTASCDSAITFIDGDKGLLLYRGYPIEQLATEGDVVDCCLLLFDGELPTGAQRAEFQAEARASRMVHESLIKFYSGFRSDAHPMAIMVGVVGALSSFFNDDFDVTSAASRRRCCINIVAKMPTLAAIAYKTAKGEPVIYPRDDMSMAQNFLYMMHARPCSAYVADPVAARCLEVIMILHADHEQNASTSTVRIAGSSQVPPLPPPFLSHLNPSLLQGPFSHIYRSGGAPAALCQARGG